MSEQELNSNSQMAKEPTVLYGQKNYASIVALAKKLASQDVHIFLFGSRARGNNRNDSDWDLLILLDKDGIEEADYEKYFDTFTELSWKISQQINPQLYTQKDWNNISYTPFYANVEHDKILIA